MKKVLFKGPGDGEDKASGTLGVRITGTFGAVDHMFRRQGRHSEGNEHLASQRDILFHRRSASTSLLVARRGTS